MEQNKFDHGHIRETKLCLHDFANEYVRELSADS